MSEIQVAKSLRWLCNQFPIIVPPKDETDKMFNAIHVYCQNGANKINDLQREVERLKVFEEYCINSFGKSGKEIICP